MGGLTAGVSYRNSGVAGASDETSYAAKYVLDAGGATVSIAGGTGTVEVCRCTRSGYTKYGCFNCLW